MDDLSAIAGLLLGSALGQFTVYLGWVALVVALLAGYFRLGWFSVGLVGLLGGLAAKFLFAGTELDQKLGGLPGQLVFNTVLYLLIACAGYAVGWLVMRVLRKDADTA